MEIRITQPDLTIRAVSCPTQTIAADITAALNEDEGQRQQLYQASHSDVLVHLSPRQTTKGAVRTLPGQTRFAQGQPSPFNAGAESVIAECAVAALNKGGEATVDRPRYCHPSAWTFAIR